MAKRLFQTLSTTLQQHCPQHVRRYHPINKTSHFSFSPNFNPSFSFNKVGFVAWYLRKLQTNPFITKAVTSSLIYTAADVTSQMITLPSSASYDLKRTFRNAIYGLLILGPSQHLWFNFLSKILRKRSVPAILMKTFISYNFFSYSGALQGENRPEVIAKLKQDLRLFWPVCDFVTFRFIPVHLQPLMNSSCAYVWIIYCSRIANRTNLTEA